MLSQLIHYQMVCIGINDFHDIPWKIDLWAFNQQQIENDMLEIQKIKKNLNEENRKLILEIKESLITDEGRTPILSGYHIYQAVLFHGLKEKTEIVEYLKRKGINIS